MEAYNESNKKPKTSENSLFSNDELNEESE